MLILTRHVERTSPGLPLLSTISSAVSLSANVGSNAGSPAQAAHAPAAASAAASPASSRQRGGPRRPRPDVRICPRRRRPRDRVERHCAGGRYHAVESPVVAFGIRSRFSCASRHRPSHLRGCRGGHHCGGASLRASSSPSSTRVSASAARLRRQRAARRPSSSSSAARSTPAHSVFGWRRASVRASSQQQQMPLVTM